MVKQQKLLCDGSSPSMVQAVAISVSSRSRMCGRRKRPISDKVVRMLSRKQADVNSGENGGVGGSGAGSGHSGSVTPGSYSNGEGCKEFLSTGRTGRRNALPDILGQHADTGTADLPSRLEALTTETKLDQPSTSSIAQDKPIAPQQHTG